MPARSCITPPSKSDGKLAAARHFRLPGDASRQLPEIKAIRPEFAEIDAQVLQGGLQRLDRAYLAFFRRVKAEQAPGFPRFRSKHRYDSLTFKQSCWSLNGRHLTLSGIGRIKLFLSREIIGRIKTVPSSVLHVVIGSSRSPVTKCPDWNSPPLTPSWAWMSGSRPCSP